MPKTILWTNPSPTSSFSSQNIGLSDDINNYDYLGVSAKQYTGDDIITNPERFWSGNLFPVPEFKLTTWNTNYKWSVGIVGTKLRGDVGTNMAVFAYVDDTTVRYTLAHVGGGNTGSSYPIPLTIFGVKGLSLED